MDCPVVLPTARLVIHSAGTNRDGRSFLHWYSDCIIPPRRQRPTRQPVPAVRAHNHSFPQPYQLWPCVCSSLRKLWLLFSRSQPSSLGHTADFFLQHHARPRFSSLLFCRQLSTIAASIFSIFASTHFILHLAFGIATMSSAGGSMNRKRRSEGGADNTRPRKRISQAVSAPSPNPAPTKDSELPELETVEDGSRRYDHWIGDLGK